MIEFIKCGDILTPNNELQSAIIREDGKSIRNRQSMSITQLENRKRSMKKIINSSAYLSQLN